ncbi:MAG: hypothetical protein Q8Q85_01295, partial [Gemmatimonadales bacterium]|nr:hypothetical protein [Gemmatimonadales bacterium]
GRGGEAAGAGVEVRGGATGADGVRLGAGAAAGRGGSGDRAGGGAGVAGAGWGTGGAAGAGAARSCTLYAVSSGGRGWVAPAVRNVAITSPCSASDPAIPAPRTPSAVARPRMLLTAPRPRPP